MDLELGGRVAIITGCSVGIGRAWRQTLQDEVVATGGPRPLAPALDGG